MIERRSASRQKSFLQGRVFFNNRRQSADCLVRDVSPTGARLVFADAITIPDVLELYLSNKDAIQRAEVQWRKGREVGVNFGGATGQGGETERRSGDIATRLARLEQECTSLRRIVMTMQAEMRKARSEMV